MTDTERPAERPAELYQLDESTCLALLGVHHVGRLIVPGDDPYVIPVNYTAAAGAVVFRTERRPVIEAIFGQPVVFEVDMFDSRTKSGWSVVVRGVAGDVTSGTDPDTITRAAPEPWAPGDKSCLVRISADRLTGRLLRGEVAPSPRRGQGYL